MLAYLQIVLLSVVAAVVYGIVHDMVTAHVCVEYFSIAHPPIIKSGPPILYALVWGVAATWWVGLPLGILLAYVCRVGKYNKLPWQVLLHPLLIFLGIMFVLAMLAGIVGYVMSLNGHNFMSPHLQEKIAAARYHRFAFDAFAHGTSYAIGFLGGLVLAALVLKWRLDG
jgi:hypothetical protein